MVCIICNEIIQSNEEKIVCNSCKVCVAHNECAKSEIRIKLGPGRKPKWVCQTCKIDKKDHGSDGSEDEDKKTEKNILEILAEMNKKLNKIDKIERDTSEIGDLKESVEFLSTKYDEVMAKLISQEKNILCMSKEVKDLKEKLITRDNEVEELSLRVQDLEQLKNVKNVEIHGMTATVGENTWEVVDKVAKVIGAPTVAQSVDDCFRVYANPNNVRKQGIPPVIVVKFKSTDARRVWLDKSKTRNLTIGKVEENENESKIFVCEHLTPDLKRLFFKTRSAAKARNWKFVWVKDGKILAKKVEDQGTIRIRCDNDIERRMPGVSY